MSQPSSSTSGPKNEKFFRALEARRTCALVERDMKTLEALHAPEYMLVTPAGRVFTRERYLVAIESGPFYAGWESSEMRFRIASEMAVVRYKAKLTFPSGRQVLCRHTDSYELRQGHWQAVWSQATELPASA